MLSECDLVMIRAALKYFRDAPQIDTQEKREQLERTLGRIVKLMAESDGDVVDGGDDVGMRFTMLHDKVHPVKRGRGL